MLSANLERNDTIFWSLLSPAKLKDRVRDVVNQALSLPSPSLIVAHGGVSVHWAICYLIGISAHAWAIDNCIPVHFSVGANGKRTAKKLVYTGN